MMEFVFWFYPVKDVKQSLALYKQRFGMEEIWWADASTVLLQTQKSNVKVMLEQDEAEERLTPGGVFLVNSVDEFFETHNEKFQFAITPCDVPPGRYAAFKDESGNVVRIVDGSKNKKFFYWD